MTDPLAQINDVARRTKVLETTSRLRRSSVREGRVEIQYEDGEPSLIFGVLDDGHHGISMQPDGGGELFRVDDRGIIRPSLQYIFRPFAPVGTFWETTVTGAAFAGQFSAKVDLIAHMGLKVAVPWVTAAGTTGELRIAEQVGNGNGATNVVVLPAASSGVAQFNWLHGASLLSGPYTWFVDARRTSGAGGITIYYPEQGLSAVGPDGCTVGGT